MTKPSHFNKKKIVRFYLISYVLLAFAIFAIGSSLTASYLQKRELSQKVSSLDLFFYNMKKNTKTKLLTLGIISVVISGFCFAAAYKEQSRS